MSDAGVERVADGERLRIAVLGDFDGVHTRAWTRWFIDRGHDVHCVSFYPPAEPLSGVTMHALRPRAGAGATGGPGAGRTSAAFRAPRGLLRLAHAARYRRAGLARVVRQIAPDVLHAHYVVEHGFYGSTLGCHPYVVTAWGSDVLVEPRDPLSRLIAWWTMARADVLTSNNEYRAGRMRELGARSDRLHVVTLGTDRSFLARHEASVNVRGDEPAPPTVLSTRAHEPLYNVGEIIDAYGRVVRQRPDVRLVVAHGGPLTAQLQRQAGTAGGRVEFLGFVDAGTLRDAMTSAQLFVSVPSSDGTSVALLQAMAAGCFPIVGDLPTQRELVEDGVNGFRVPLHRPDRLADAMVRALADEGLRRSAAERNRALVLRRGLNETEMLRMEELYREAVEANRHST
ncbi:MAG: glycosyltransferase [Chloroflexi bacterium]|nr:glycosyltransferase [Chloroflexota bacterium]